MVFAVATGGGMLSKSASGGTSDVLDGLTALGRGFVGASRGALISTPSRCSAQQADHRFRAGVGEGGVVDVVG
jgi:hypothetical protein